VKIPFSKMVLAVPLLLTLGACVQMPTGPDVAVMPGPYKPFEAFAADDNICRQFAQSQVGGTASADQNGATGRVVAGAATGAAAGALIADSSRGAGVGAGAGLLVGTMAGGGYADQSSYGLQRRYDLAYQQCMYSKGNQVPGFAVATPVAPPPPNQPAPRR
jgi:hypothetical protein